MLPSRVHAIVLVSKLHKPTLRALAFAKAARPYMLEAVTVDVDRDESEALQAEWDARGIPIPLKRLASPYREITRPILQYVRDIRRQSPRDVVMVYIPEYVVGHWWEHILHNQSALRLKGRLLFTPGVMVTSVPYQLISSQAAEERQDREERVAGQVRRGARKSVRRSVTDEDIVGTVVELEVGPVAHGGHCVARLRGPGGVRPARVAG